VIQTVRLLLTHEIHIFMDHKLRALLLAQESAAAELGPHEGDSP